MHETEVDGMEEIKINKTSDNDEHVHIDGLSTQFYGGLLLFTKKIRTKEIHISIRNLILVDSFQNVEGVLHVGFSPPHNVGEDSRQRRLALISRFSFTVLRRTIWKRSEYWLLRTEM